jgi:hypothetical protein
MVNSIFKAGDSVECLSFGKGIVKIVMNPMLHHITGVGLIDCPIVVEFKHGIKQYTLDGRLEKWGKIILSKTD